MAIPKTGRYLPEIAPSAQQKAATPPPRNNGILGDLEDGYLALADDLHSLASRLEIKLEALIGPDHEVAVDSPQQPHDESHAVGRLAAVKERARNAYARLRRLAERVEML